MIKVSHNKKEIIWCIALLLLMPVWIGLAPVLYDWFDGKGNGFIIKYLYELLDGLWLVNVPIGLVLAFNTYRWISRICKDYNLRFYRPILTVIGLVLLFAYGDRVVYANIVWKIDYRLFIAVLLFIALIVMAVKGTIRFVKWFGVLWQKCKKEKKEKEQHPQSVGFSDDNGEKKEIPQSLQVYADEIINRVLATNIKEQSYAIGVTGEWGVGKTTFLDELEKKIGKRAEVVKFNPWMCSTPEQVTHDFFASLRHQLSEKYSTLSRSIREYAKYVSSLSLEPSSAIKVDLSLPDNKESLFERKRILSEKFSRLPLPVVVIIDDVDRLERDEVFEVLRLIRNTADLSNVIYLVAYDKEYVTSVLEDKEIKDATAYLEKIFQVEVHLPKVEDQLIWNLLYKDIAEQFSKVFADKLFELLKSDEKELVLTILDNYRRVKRFARIYSLAISYLKKQVPGEVKQMDVFWLELLQVYDKKTYDVLANNPECLLYRDEIKYRIRDGVQRPATEKDKNRFVGEPFWEKETPKILERLFGNYIKTKKQSICFIENYSKYFVMSVSPFRLSISEINSIFDEGVNVEELVVKWVDGKKYFSSIAYQFKQIEVNKLKDNELKAFLRGVLTFGLRVSRYVNSNAYEIKRILWSERYVSEIQQKAHDIVMAWFAEKLKDADWLLCQAYLLNMLYETVSYDEEGRPDEKHPLVISNQEVEAMLAKAMKYYLASHPEYTALDVMKDSGGLYNMFKYCCVTVKDRMMIENYCEYKQVAFDVVTDYFAKKEQKPTLAEFDAAYGKIFSEKTPVFDDPQDEYDYWDYMSEKFERRMQEYFGSSFDKKDNSPLEVFKTKCFVDRPSGEIVIEPQKKTELDLMIVKLKQEKPKKTSRTKKKGEKGKKCNKGNGTKKH